MTYRDFCFQGSLLLFSWMCVFHLRGVLDRLGMLHRWPQLKPPKFDLAVHKLQVLACRLQIAFLVLILAVVAYSILFRSFDP